ncbi:RNA polymerase subunit RPO18, partial [Monkeypox virus]
DIVRG